MPKFSQFTWTGTKQDVAAILSQVLVSDGKPYEIERDRNQPCEIHVANGSKLYDHPDFRSWFDDNGIEQSAYSIGGWWTDHPGTGMAFKFKTEAEAALFKMRWL